MRTAAPGRRGTAAPLALLALLSVAAGAGCRDVMGTPARAKTHGFRAHATIRDEKTETHYELAVRGEDRRREPPAGTAGKVLLWKGAERMSYELDPSAKTFTERAFTSLDEALPGHPLTFDFSETEEARRRNAEKYRREGDTVFAGRACWLWAFEDRFDDPTSPITTFWIAPDLDRLVVRVDNEGTPDAKGERPTRITQLTDVRVNAPAALFEIPKDFKPAAR